MRHRAAAALGAALLVAGDPPRAAIAHPLHTSLAEVTYDPAARAVHVLLRVFVDDFSSAVLHARPAAPDAPIVLPPDSAMFRYVSGRFSLADRAGRPVPLRWCGARRAGEQLFVCLRAPATTAPGAGARVRNALLTELFTDQINVVRASVSGRRQTLLFTRGDGVKALR